MTMTDKPKEYPAVFYIVHHYFGSSEGWGNLTDGPATFDEVLTTLADFFEEPVQPYPTMENVRVFEITLGEHAVCDFTPVALEFAAKFRVYPVYQDCPWDFPEQWLEWAPEVVKQAKKEWYRE